jgi:hypothetical protein
VLRLAPCAPPAIALVLAGVLFLAGCSAGDSADSAGEPAPTTTPTAACPSRRLPRTRAAATSAGRTARGPTPTPVTQPTPTTGSRTASTHSSRRGWSSSRPRRWAYSPVLGEISAYAEAHGGGRVHRSFTAATEYQGAHGLITVKLPPRELCTAPMPPRRRSRSRRSRAPPQGPGPSSPPPAPPGGRSPATGSRPPDPPITGAGPSRAGNPIKEPEGHGRDANRGRFGPEWVTIRKPLPEVVISP